MDNFSKFGWSFQVKVVACLLFDRSFFLRMYDILEPSYFDQKTLEWVVQKAIEHYRQYKVVPTLDVYKVLLTDIESDVALHQSVVDALREVVRHKNASDLEFVKTESLTFCKNQVMKLAVLKSADLLQEGKFEAIKKEIALALNAGEDRSIGHEYKDGLEERYLAEIRNPLPTPWDQMTKLMDGGLGMGELGVVIAPAGAGKSWILCALAAHAMLQGKKVLYYTMELRNTYIGRRVDSILTGIPFTSIINQKDVVAERLKTVSGDIIIAQYPAKRASIVTLETHFEKCISLGFTPDVVVIDYADLLKTASGGNERRFDLEDIYTDLRSFGAQYNIPVWTATQSNRGGMNLDIIEGDSVSESYSKIMIADFIFSHSRKKEDKLANTARWHIVKNRMGADGMTFPVSFNGDNGSITIHDENTPSGKAIMSAVRPENKEKLEKERLRKKLDEFSMFG